MTLETIKRLIVDVPDFPKPGIVFKDISPLLADPQGFAATIEALSERAGSFAPDAILAIESRGFVFGSALAHQMNLPFHLVRKQGKLPRDTISMSYELEYGIDHLEVHADAIVSGKRYLIVDDVIATGGTAAAVAGLVAQQNAEVAGYAFVIELGFLAGREKLNGSPIVSLITY